MKPLEDIGPKPIIITEETNQEVSEPCPFCGAKLGIVWLHGHGQCPNCNKNIEPCCEGIKRDWDKKNDSGF
jgi:hypothetical protein